MRILGIETSCDETAASIIEVDRGANSIAILGNAVHSQIEQHVPYGGVFPSLAKREHAANLVPVLARALEQARLSAEKSAPLSSDQEACLRDLLAKEPELFASLSSFLSVQGRPDIDLISVTVGPGLEPALWVGINFARALSYAWDIPIVPSNHMEGHILTALIERLPHSPDDRPSYDLLDKRIMYPALSLLISGGHTQIVLVEALGRYSIIGETRDDAIGECFDKIARMLGLAYPGGPKISKLAAEARAKGIQSPEPLPRPMIDSSDLDFSFSGLKTAVLYLLKRLGKDATTLDDDTRAGIAREAEDAVVDVVSAKMRKAIEAYAVETLIIGGGVIANARIREALERLAEDTGTRLLLPQLDHSTDNALMIALAGYFGKERATGWDAPLKASGTLALGPRA